MAIRYISTAWKNNISDRNTMTIDCTERVYFDFRGIEYQENEDRQVEWSYVASNNNSEGSHKLAAFIGSTNLVDDPNDLTTANWTANNATATQLNSSTWNFRYTKILNSGAASGYVEQTFSGATFTNDLVISGISKKGSTATNTALIVLRDTSGAADRLNVTIDYDAGSLTVTTGTELRTYWIDSNTVYFQVATTAITTANTHELRLYASPNATADEYNLWTGLQIDDNSNQEARYLINYDKYESLTRADHKLYYLNELTNEGTLVIKVNPWFNYDDPNDKVFINWQKSATEYFKIYYNATDDKIRAEWQDGGTLRYLESQQFDDGSSFTDINQWIKISVTWDFDNSTGQLWINDVSQDTAWSGTTDSITSSFPIMYVGGPSDETSNEICNSEIAYLKYYANKEATTAELTNYLNDVKEECIYWDFNGHALGRTRVDVTRFVNNYTLKKSSETQNGTQSANEIKIDLNNESGEFSDDQYASYEPSTDSFNGLVTEKFLQRKINIFLENHYQGEFESLFIGRCDPGSFGRNTTIDDISRVSIDAIDFVIDFVRNQPRVKRAYKDYEICEANEGNSLLHTITRLGSQRNITNYLTNSSFENTTIANSWNVTTGSIAKDTTAPLLFGANHCRLTLSGGSGVLYQEVTFESEELIFTDQFNFSCWVRSTTGTANVTIDLEQYDGAVFKTQSTSNYPTVGTEWTKIEVSHNLSIDSTDRLRCLFSVTGNNIDIDGCMLINYKDSKNMFILNSNDGSSGVSASSQGVSQAYDVLGFDVESIFVTHPYAVIDRESNWEYHKDIAEATADRYYGIGSAGELRYRAFLSQNGDPEILETIDKAQEIETTLDIENYNKIRILGSHVVIDEKDSTAWRLSKTGAFPKKTYSLPGFGNGIKARAEVANGADFPSKTTFGHYNAKYNFTGNNNTKVIGLDDPQLRQNIIKQNGDKITFTTTTLDTTTDTDSARLLLNNGSGSTGYVLDVSLIGKYITKSGMGERIRKKLGTRKVKTGKWKYKWIGIFPVPNEIYKRQTVYREYEGIINDVYEDKTDIFETGERLLEFANDFIITKDQCDKLASFYWQENRTKRHEYVLRFPGRYFHIEPGEWYTLQIEDTRGAESIDSVVECIEVNIERNAENYGNTQFVFREIKQNIDLDKTKDSRTISSGRASLDDFVGDIIKVAPSDSTESADYYCDGTNDEVEINEAIVQANTTGGATVLLLKGTFNIETNPITMLSNVVLAGEGSGTVIDRNLNDNIIEASAVTNISITDMNITNSDSNDTNYIFIEDSTNITIANIVFNSTTNLNRMIRCEDSTTIRIVNSSIDDCKDFIYMLGCNNLVIDSNTVEAANANGILTTLLTGDLTDATITNNTIKNCAQYGINMGNTNESTISNNYIDTCNFAGIRLSVCDNVNVSNNIIKDSRDVGINLASCNKINVDNNVIDTVTSGSTGFGIKHTGNSALSPSTEIIISNNICNATGDYGMYIEKFFYNGTISNNRIIDTDLDGIYFYDSIESNIVNNIIESPGRYGIQVGVTSLSSITQLNISANTIKSSNNTGILLDDIQYSAISSNTIQDAGVAATDRGINIEGTSTYNTISNNTVIDSYGTGIRLGSTSASNNVIGDNVCNINGTDGIGVSGDNNTISGNVCNTNGQYGIRTEATANRTVITGNRAAGNTTANYSNGGTNTTNSGNDFV